MATFATFNTRLPDPTFLVSNAGSVEASGSTAAGFANVSMSSNRPSQVSRTLSGRGIHATSGAHHWEVNISYNPMKKSQFDPIMSFLEAHDGRLNPFFVVLPQHSVPKDVTFAAHVTSNAVSVVGAHVADSSTLLVDCGVAFAAYASPMDCFTITDASDINHLKFYRVTRVETNALYQTGTTQPSTSQMRLHISPPLVRAVADNAVINWINPAMRVVQKSDVLEYQLSTDNLFNFQLNLEEILP
jgi:hypothetical protein